MKLTVDELETSAREDSQAPAGLNAVQRVLWLARAGRWHEAHEQCQDLPSPAAEWIHAHLHREEGDLSNACYWYSLVDKTLPQCPLEEEWRELAAELG